MINHKEHRELKEGYRGALIHRRINPAMNFHTYEFFEFFVISVVNEKGNMVFLDGLRRSQKEDERGPHSLETLASD